MTLEQLYREEQSLKLEVLNLELERVKLESDNIDFNSKETMIKLKTNLRNTNVRYAEVDDLIDMKGLEISKRTRLIDITQTLIKDKLLTTFDQIDNFITKCLS